MKMKMYFISFPEFVKVHACHGFLVTKPLDSSANSSRYGYFHDACDEQIKNLICFFIEMWLDKYPEDFCKSKDLDILNQLMAYLLVNMPFSELTVRSIIC
ncbi:ral guanine nucleotide dissociation stimulator-like [Castor canadensis]|uniref:Ral guanine nucleotide dissociation stimulator-like n=1 Tax=Castor canadensis TaxID=51338 RepID=A0AC58LL16_CASCN